MNELKELITKRAAAWDRMKALNDAAESRSLTTEEDGEWNKLELEVERLSKLITLATGRAPEHDERMSRVLGEPRRAPVTGEEAVLAPEQRMSDWLEARGQSGPWAKENLSMGRTLRAMGTGDWKGAEAERRAMQESSDTAGGYYLPAPLASWVIDNLRADAVVLAAGARTVPMDNAELAVAVVTGDPTAAWRQELTTITPGDGNTLGRIYLRAQSCIVDVLASRELLQDAPNAAAVLEDSMRKALSLKLDYAALAGIGAEAEPKGLRSYSVADGINIVTLDPNGFAYSHDYVLDAINDILADNAPMPTAMIMHPRTRVGMASMKDGNGLPLPLPDLVKDLRMLTTTQVAIDDTHGTASNASRVYVGDFVEMYIGIRQQIMIEASPYATTAWEKHGVIFRAHLRADVQLAHAQSFGVVEGVLPN